jgi:hypothetical protein
MCWRPSEGGEASVTAIHNGRARGRQPVRLLNPRWVLESHNSSNQVPRFVYALAACLDAFALAAAIDALCAICSSNQIVIGLAIYQVE